MRNAKRPLSPHLQIYKLPLTGIVSITHRMTGVILAAGLLIYTLSFYYIFQGGESFTSFQTFLDNGLVRFAIWLYIFSLFFHLCHGVRHLIWDVGQTFEQANMDRNAMIEIVIALLLTLIFY